jgi:hypothetical protein
MSRPAREPAYRWQMNPIFRLFSSVKLAIVLLTVLIVASIIGTLYESNFDAKVARHYIYEAPWFNLWLLTLALNLAVAALSRMPWKRHHTGFLITHLGIIILLAGAWIGRTWGIEGTMTLFKGEPPNNFLLVDQKVLQVSTGLHVSHALPVEIMGRKPTPAKPWDISRTPDGWGIALTDYSPSLDVDMTPKALPAGGTPAIHINVATAMMGQKLDSWLIADDPSNGIFSMGLAAVSLKRGTAPGVTGPVAQSEAKPTGPVELEEAIFAFAKASDQVAKSLKGGLSGAKVTLTGVTPTDAGTVTVQHGGRPQEIPVRENLNKEVPLAGTDLVVSIKNYWPDFRIRDGGPESVSEDPNNPAVLVMIHGKAVPIQPAPEHSDSADAAGENSLVLYVDDQSRFTYELSSRKGGKSAGTLELNKPLPTGWADWTLSIDQFLPHASEHFTARPAPPDQTGGRRVEGIRVRASRGEKSAEEWVPLGWQISLPTEPPLGLAYGFRQAPLPIGLRLLEFEVERNEGTDTPAGFKSTVEITTVRGEKVVGQCWMNNPISFPGTWLHTWSGFTYKISQASWNPENLGQSTVQILRDPGWGLKWIGSLLVCCGVFTMFYLRPYPDAISPRKSRRSPDGQPLRTPETPATARASAAKENP